MSQEHSKTYKDIFGYFGFVPLYEYIVPLLSDNDVILEYGIYKGRSCAYLQKLLWESNKKIEYHILDTFNGSAEHNEGNFYNEFINNMNNLDIKYPYILHTGNGYEIIPTFPDEFFSFVMIDAAHEYENIKKDIELLLPKIKKGGVIGGDDYDWDGVKKAVTELISSPMIVPRQNGKDCINNIDAGNFWYKIV